MTFAEFFMVLMLPRVCMYGALNLEHCSFDKRGIPANAISDQLVKVRYYRNKRIPATLS